MASLASHYDALEVPHDADAAALRASYRRRSLELHPDRPDGDAAAFRRVQAAWETLRDAEARAAYDAAEGLGDRAEDVVVWRDVAVADFSRPAAAGAPRALACRCGGAYELFDDELDGVDLVPCDGCSCHVRVVAAAGPGAAAAPAGGAAPAPPPR